jgi:NIPSNAP
MRKTLTLFVAVCLTVSARAADKEERVYEMRIYYAAPGKLEALNARFRDHTLKLFEKHGITNVGYWVPIDNKDNKLIYLLSYPSREARDKAWKAFVADPEWQKAFKESEKDGKLVAKSENPFLVPTDYSPAVKPSKDGDRVFELRTYTATKGNLDALNARFRDHTLKLFEKHGMTNLWYFTLMKDQKGADETLVYFLAHKSVDAAKASFDSFRKDPDWVKARTASEEKAGGSLTVKEGGVKSEFLKPTDYSPLK